ncbi:MAG: lysine--tRNA ligase [Candidatus Marinimicrobia bacterium]|nr:lysine--tRNA ligase [Candidatus Neomarinimicrobiota bacterium]|tara:strand:+ start:403 stop:1887 length:1485 start_codon:yes stop_codon:yes gene_type:complete
MVSKKKSLKQVMDFRLEKLESLLKNRINPYPPKFQPKHKSMNILSDYDNYEGLNVIVAGRIMALRKMGKASFVQLMDDEGKIQIFVRNNDIGDENYSNFKLLDIGDFIGVEGEVFKTKTGEITIKTHKLTILAKSIRPLPIVKEKDGQLFDSFTDKEQRYRKRHLDLILNPEVRETFQKRSKIISSIRNFFDNQGFLEVETPILQPIYGGANARPFTTHHNTLNQKLYLRIADELYLKRLIIGGFDRVYEIAKNFRNEGMDRNHNPEFTMLEFYWAYSDYEDCMNLVEQLFAHIAKKLDSFYLDWGDSKIDLTKKFHRKSFFELLSQATGHNLDDFDEKKIKLVCKENKIDMKDNANIGQMLDELMSSLVEPNLIEPTFVIDYPKLISPLAKLHRNGNPNIVERFELFIGGSEVANSFSELNDPLDQRTRLEEQSKLKELGDEEAQPIDEDFIQAVECGMPPTGGVGIGIDRLIMLLTGNRWIKDVILFPPLRT